MKKHFIRSLILLSLSSLLLLFTLFACNSVDSQSNPTGGVPANDDMYWCSHTDEEKAWIHDISGEFHEYVGSRDFEKLDAKMVELTKDMAAEEMWEFTTLPQFFKIAELKPQEVIAVFNAINANDINFRGMKQGRISEQQKQKVLNDLFGDNFKLDGPTVNATYPVENGEGLLFGTESISSMKALNATAENCIPRIVVYYVGVRNYNEWASNVTREDYNIINFLTTFEVPVDIFDSAIESRVKNNGTTIYTQEYYSKVRLTVYGEDKTLFISETTSSAAPIVFDSFNVTIKVGETQVLSVLSDSNPVSIQSFELYDSSIAVLSDIDIESGKCTIEGKLPGETKVIAHITEDEYVVCYVTVNE